MPDVDGIPIEKYNRLVCDAIEDIERVGGYISFSGQSSCDDLESGCLGWDGVSYRCSCGNRRVYWEISDDGESVYACAN